MADKEVHLKIPINYFDAETGKAICFALPDGKVWLPKSQIKDWTVNGSNVSFWVPQWLTGQNNLGHFLDTSYMPSLFE